MVGKFYDATTQTLRFDPKLPAPFELPVLIPRTVATLRADKVGQFTFMVLTGAPLPLRELSVRGAQAKDVPQLLAPG